MSKTVDVLRNLLVDQTKPKEFNMKRYEDDFNITILLLLMSIVVLMGACLLKLIDIKNIMQKQFDYQIEMQFCMQDAIEYLAPCRLEMDTDGNVHWYYNANEGRM